MSKTYFVATKHASYVDAPYEDGSTVIDPWRYIPETAATKVWRVGENKPALISILVPSRGRPDWLFKTVSTAFATATHQRRIEFEVYLDEDDSSANLLSYETEVPFAVHVDLMKNIRFQVGPRRLLSECWNLCAERARGEIMMHCGDDLTFNTPGWDQMVRDEFVASDDKILFVHGDDLGPHGKVFGTHGFLHRKWVETVGYFVPPLFSSDWNDVWLNDVANALGRRKLLDFVTEHWHYTFGKAERDQTHAEREERGKRDDVVSLYKRTRKQRESDIAKLKTVMT